MRTDNFKAKIPSIAKAIPDIPFRIFAATSADGYRKPMLGIWHELERIFAEDGVTVEKEASFFVGDAAGRLDDFSSTDRKFAENVGVEFHTPESYFLGLGQNLPPLAGFRPPVHASASESRVTPPDLPIISSTLPELVLFVGMPCLGKTTFYRTHFASPGYVHINQDTLKTRQKCVKAAEEALHEGRSCVIDNTNRDVATRKHYVDVAKKHNIPVRCFLFDGSMELAWHNNLYRAYNLPPSRASKEASREILPYLAFSGYRDNYEEPTDKEGFSELRTVSWIFEGDEEERKHWGMWLQVSGK